MFLIHGIVRVFFAFTLAIVYMHYAEFLEVPQFSLYPLATFPVVFGMYNYKSHGQWQINGRAN